MKERKIKDIRVKNKNKNECFVNLLSLLYYLYNTNNNNNNYYYYYYYYYYKIKKINM